MLDKTVDWGKENGIIFNLAKTKVMHFSKRRPHPDDVPPPDKL